MSWILITICWTHIISGIIIKTSGHQVRRLQSCSISRHAIWFGCRILQFFWTTIPKSASLLLLLSTTKMPHVSILEHWAKIKRFSSFDGTTYSQIADSTFSHQSTYGLGNYRGEAALTTGCRSPSECHRKTEKLDMTTLTWSTVDDYPYTTM